MKSDHPSEEAGTRNSQALATRGLWLVALILAAMIASRVGPLILMRLGG